MKFQMNVQVELVYSAIPSEAEMEEIRQAGLALTNDRKSVSVRLVETAEQPRILLEFMMKAQAQYKSWLRFRMKFNVG
jgi:hypothetical protein